MQSRALAPPVLVESLKDSLDLEMLLKTSLDLRSLAGPCCAPSRTVCGAGTVQPLAMRSQHSRTLRRPVRVRLAWPIMHALQADAGSASHMRSQSSCAQRGPHQAPMTLMHPVLSVACSLESPIPLSLGWCTSCCSGGMQRGRSDSDRVLRPWQPRAAGATWPRQQGWQPAQELPPGFEQASTMCDGPACGDAGICVCVCVCVSSGLREGASHTQPSLLHCVALGAYALGQFHLKLSR